MKKVIAYYHNQTEEDQVAEHEAALAAQGETMMLVPKDLVPEIRKLLARRSRA